VLIVHQLLSKTYPKSISWQCTPLLGRITSRWNSLYALSSSVWGPRGIRSKKHQYCRYFVISFSPLCANFGNKSMMIRIMKKWHSDAYASKPYSVDCPSQDIVTLQGDPASLPSHPPRSSSLRINSIVLMKAAGNVDQVHDVHLFGNHLGSFVARCSKIEIQLHIGWIGSLLGMPAMLV
jgi:hypothetical protein